MRIGKVFVNIAGGNERDGYVRLNHGKEYMVSVSSDFDQPASAEIKIDGKLAGVWRIPAHGSINIERPVNEQRKFTFYRHGTSEAVMLDSVHPDISGVVSVRVIPGRPARVPDYSPMQDFDAPVMRSYTFGGGATRGSSGMTGLGSASSQRFGSAGEIELDHSQAITVNLRLVCEEDQNPVPLRDARSNPVPPAIY